MTSRLSVPTITVGIGLVAESNHFVLYPNSFSVNAPQKSYYISTIAE